MRIKTPKELAKSKAGKDKFTLYLDVNLMAFIKEAAAKADTNASVVVNEAISAYVEEMKKRDGSSSK